MSQTQSLSLRNHAGEVLAVGAKVYRLDHFQGRVHGEVLGVYPDRREPLLVQWPSWAQAPSKEWCNPGLIMLEESQ
jgi:hypothetical protein